ncbi:MAG: pyruvate dehydrogenase (acetyl-transferring) E1 component subunit alpha [Hyphomicrobiaceae bacterium]
MSSGTELGPATRIVASFDIPFTRYIDAAGTSLATLPAFANDADELIRLYRAMMLTRIFDEKAIALQRTGRMGTYASSLGQEAVGVGTASAMQADDVLLPSFREQSAMLWRGVTMAELLTYWGGNERGSDFKGPREDFPICIPVGTQFPHASGVALAMQIRRQPRCAVAMGGDGATSKGDFYEALNMAGVWKLPLLVVINDNQWAISVPRKAQSATQTLAQKAVAVGIACEQVDGCDVVAVRDAAARALARARAGEGATLIEAVTYRLSDHTTADDAKRYRPDAEVSAHWKGEPVARLRAHLVARGAWTKEQELALIADLRREVEAAAAAYLASPPPPATDMFDYLFEELPTALEPQRARLVGQTGGDHG